MDFKPNWQWHGIDPKAKHIFTEHCSATTRWPCWTSKVCLHVWSAGSSFFLKSLQLIISTLIYDAVKGWCDKQQLWPTRVKGWLQVGFIQGISMGNYFLRGSRERHFWDSFQGAIFLEVSLRVEGDLSFRKLIIISLLVPRANTSSTCLTADCKR